MQLKLASRRIVLKLNDWDAFLHALNRRAVFLLDGKKKVVSIMEQSSKSSGSSSDLADPGRPIMLPLRSLK